MDRGLAAASSTELHQQQHSIVRERLSHAVTARQHNRQHHRTGAAAASAVCTCAATTGTMVVGVCTRHSTPTRNFHHQHHLLQHHQNVVEDDDDDDEDMMMDYDHVQQEPLDFSSKRKQEDDVVGGAVCLSSTWNRLFHQQLQQRRTSLDIGHRPLLPPAAAAGRGDKLLQHSLPRSSPPLPPLQEATRCAAPAFGVFHAGVNLTVGSSTNFHGDIAATEVPSSLPLVNNWHEQHESESYAEFRRQMLHQAASRRCFPPPLQIGGLSAPLLPPLMVTSPPPLPPPMQLPYDVVGKKTSPPPPASSSSCSSRSPSPPIINRRIGVSAADGATPITMKRRGRSLPDELKDDAYWERRRKNNEAAKRSRDARRAKEDEIAIRAAYLEQENLKLRVEVASLKSETAKLRCLLYNS